MATLELRDYQKEAIEKWKQRGQKGILVLPTGTGKTYIALAVIKEELEQSGKIAVIVPTIVLAHQWQAKIYQYIGIKPTLYYTHEKGIGKITIFVVNSAYMNRHLLQYFTLIIVDEIHHLSAPTWKQIVDTIKDNKKILGLTATPENAILPIVYYMGIGLAREKKAVVNVEIKPVYAELTFSERMQYEQVDQAIRDIARKLDSAKAYGYKAEMEKLDRMLKIMANKRKQLMSEIQDKAFKVLQIAKAHPNEKILVFTESIRGAEKIAKLLNDNNIKTVTIHSQKSKAIRNTLLAEWGKSYRILIAVRSLDEGVDIPDVSIGIIVATGKTIRQLTQRLGRILRPAPNKEKAIMYVVLARNTYETSILWKLNKVAFSR
uniref:Type III restriction enzyme, res subunit n=1 Tax=archaeon enrichment culture clone 1(2010) TaxID=795325 RepID=D9CGF7_9ARCH|nr:type III restriction enzyme, res subunit [archaeon enrichment culture clone 1(2010)]